MGSVTSLLDHEQREKVKIMAWKSLEILFCRSPFYAHPYGTTQNATGIWGELNSASPRSLAAGGREEIPGWPLGWQSDSSEASVTVWAPSLALGVRQEVCSLAVTSWRAAVSLWPKHSP